MKRFRRVYVGQVDSTQRFLRALWAENPDLPPTLLWTGHQTAGYGRKGTPWIAPLGKSLPFSLLDRPQEPLSLWGARIALSLYETVKAWCRGPLYLKWPNDLYAPTGKLAGLLIEAQWQGNRLMAAFAGIGLNVYRTDFPPGLWATTLEEVGQAPPTLEIVLDTFEERFVFWEGVAPTQVEATFTACLWKEGPFRINGLQTEGTITAWRADGYLEISTPEGPERIQGHLVEMIWPPPAWPWT